MRIIWTIVIGFVAGVLAKFLTPGDRHQPQGFILTTALGIAGAFLMTYLKNSIRLEACRATYTQLVHRVL
jgi:uncharacterized membrane protein YeaQ/YmgE (transglycosylase-associated protein family)